MFKKTLNVVVLVLSVLSLSATSYFYYADGEKAELEFDGKTIALYFENYQKGVKNFENRFQKILIKEKLENENIIIVELKNQNVNDFFEEIKEEKAPAFFSPVFEFNDNVKLIVINRFIVQFKTELSNFQINRILNEYDSELLNPTGWDKNSFFCRIRPSKNGIDLLETVNSLRENEDIIYAEPDFLNLMKRLTTDTYYNYQWFLHNTGGWPYGTVDADIDAPEAWAINTGSASITVAVLDDGCEINHPDLNDKIDNPYDAVDSDYDPTPNSWDGHGTCCSGLAAAETNNSQGVAGVSYDCLLMGIRIFYSAYDGGPLIGYNSWTVNGINHARDNGADVLSVSWTMSSSTSVTNAFNSAHTTGRGGLGCIITAATGNDNASSISYPSNLSSIVAVGGTNEDDYRCTPSDWGAGQGSNYGTGLDVVAPGNYQYTTDVTGSGGYNGSGDYYQYFGGTSGAAPVAAGVVALILSVDPTLTATEAEDILKNTADDEVGDPSEDTPGYDIYMGYGRVNAHQAVVEASGGTPEPSILVDPTSLSQSLPPDGTDSQILQITNDGDPGSNLTYTISYGYTRTNNNFTRERDGRNISGSTFESDINEYTSGTTFDIVFTIYNNSGDWEWLDGATLDFPTDITVNSSTNFVGGTDGDLVTDNNTGNGAMITWTDENGGWGNIYGGESAVSTVNITVSGGFSGDMVLDWTLSGDDYGSDPHDISGTITLTESAPSESWLDVNPLSGDCDHNETDNITVDFDAAGMEEGIYTAEISISHNAAGSPEIIPVTLTVETSIPDITVLPSSFTQTLLPDETASQTLYIGNDGDADSTLDYTAEIEYSSRSRDIIFEDGYETYTDFTLSFPPWTQFDGDGSATYGATSFDFLNEHYVGSYIIFNSTQTDPPDPSGWESYTGVKHAACFSATTPPNDDWMFTPQLSLNANGELTFRAKSITDQYGLERFEVGVSTTDTDPSSFTIISASPYVEAPVSWTEYIYDLSAYEGFDIYIGIHCISHDAFSFFVDDFSVSCDTGPTYSWLSLDGGESTSDTVLEGSPDDEVNVGFDAAGLVEGTYEADIVITSNDPDESPYYVPVTLNVTNQLDAPANLVITHDGSIVTLTWDTVTGATSYTVYSDTDPYGTFTFDEWTGADTTWNEPLTGDKKFYRVTASN